jgi:dTDP-4-dehydrorhamnose 3,5-epimerase
MVEIRESDIVAGVKVVTLKVFCDQRGHFLETFRKEWFPERDWNLVQTNCSFSRAGVLRGLHFHHRQVDYWYVPNGQIRVGLADLRPQSPTYRKSQTIEIGQDNPVGIFIPVGIAHGFLSLTDTFLTYLVDNYYDGNDEYGVRWDDPALGLKWGTEAPILSARDRDNPLLQEIDPGQLPGLQPDPERENGSGPDTMSVENIGRRT